MATGVQTGDASPVKNLDGDNNIGVSGDGEAFIFI
jgi:hypothetical protein